MNWKPVAGSRHEEESLEVELQTGETPLVIIGKYDGKRWSISPNSPMYFSFDVNRKFVLRANCKRYVRRQIREFCQNITYKL